MDSLGGHVIRRRKDESRLQDLAAGWVLAIFSGIALFSLTARWPEFTHDDITHLRRIEALVSSFRAGVLFPRWFPDLMFGYGAPVFNYYPFGSYYPPALVHLAGVDLLMSVRVAFSLGFALSAWWMYRLSRLYVSLWPAVVSVVCFQFFPYRLHDLFVRGAFPEFSAFFWLPAIALFTSQAAKVSGRSSDALSLSKSLVLAGLAWAILILTHNLSAFMGAILLGAQFILTVAFAQGKRAVFRRLLVGSVAPLALGLMLSAWYVAPALLELGWVMNGDGLFSGFGSDHFLKLGELVDLSVFYDYSDQIDRPRLTLFVIPAVLGALLAIPKIRSRELRTLTVSMLVLTIALSWLMTDTSTWLWNSVEAIIDLIQFPWRWQILISFGVALLLAAFLETLGNSRHLKTTTLPLVSVLFAIYMVANATVNLDYHPREEGATSNHWYDSIETWTWFATRGPVPLHLYPVEFTKSIDEAIEAGRSPWEDDSIKSLDFGAAVTPTKVGLLNQQYIVATEQPFRLLFHQINFPAWRVTVDNEQVDTRPATGLSLASVEIPPGTHSVDFAWRPTRAVWIGRLVTLLGWIVVLLLLSRADRAIRPDGLAQGSRLRAAGRAWPALACLVAGAFMVVSASGITVRTWEVEKIGADYGHIRLEGVRSIQPVRGGEVAPVHLTWFAKDKGTPVSAFVHLVDDDGNGLSQHDGPPGGVHTHFQRWTPGLILESVHFIVIPDNLPSGNYRLFAGLYYPDVSHGPLMPLNGDSSRLEIGSVNVLP